MQDQLLTLVQEIKSNHSAIIFYDEAATKQELIMQTLSALGWNIFKSDEIKPEYALAGRRVDYALRIQGANKVFVEVKKPAEDLEKHQQQLLDYSFAEGVRLAVLTNGVTWWFYLPLREGSWEQRKFYAIDIIEQEAADIASKFERILSRASVSSGQAAQYAEQMYADRERSLGIATNLPKAWDKIVSDPDELLVELINETLEKLSGFKAEDAQVKSFLARHRAQLLVGQSTTSLQPSQPAPVVTPSQRPLVQRRSPGSAAESYQNKTPVGFSFQGQRYGVSTWIEMLLTLTQIIQRSHQHEMDRCLQLRGRLRPYFSRDKNELRMPRQISGTGIYFESHLNVDQIVDMSRRFAAAFGYRDTGLKIEARG